MLDNQIADQKPIYNIGIVTRMTGISISTLRVWERRYSFPQSSRTAGGHRLYSEQDVMRLRWIKARIDEGMQTSQAIQALLHQEKNGNALPKSVVSIASTISNATPNIDHYKQQLLEALIRHDTQTADQILGEALPLYNTDGLMLDLIEPTLAELGEAWANNRIGVATEHLASNYLRQRLMMWMLSGPPPFEMQPIVLACAPEEWHEGSLLILGALLRRRRYPVAYLGQAVPLADLTRLVRDIQPPMVVLVAMREESAALLADWQHYLPEVTKSGKPIVCYGGRIFTNQPEWRSKIPGTFLGNNLRDGLEMIEKLLKQ
jgi:DNA-binding transcriptional MerR regulator